MRIPIVHQPSLLHSQVLSEFLKAAKMRNRWAPQTPCFGGASHLLCWKHANGAQSLGLELVSGGVASVPIHSDLCLHSGKFVEHLADDVIRSSGVFDTG